MALTIIEVNLKIFIATMTNFEEIVGNNIVKNRLELLCRTNSVPHLLLFCGMKGVGKRLFAEALAKKWLDNGDGFAADMHLFSPEGKSGMHSIQAIRRFIDEVNLAPFSAGKKAFIIDDAERMLPTSANALLKTLEEPPQNTLIILVTSAPERLLATILSRGQMVRFCPLSKTEVEQILVEKQKVSADVADQLAKASHGSVAQALRSMSLEGEALEKNIFAHLAKKRGFHEIALSAKEFQKRLDSKRKAEESELKSQFGLSLKDSTPAMRQLIEQEIEGALSLSIMQEVNELFFVVQAFFLDLERLQANLPLHFEGQRQILAEGLKAGRKVPFERVASSIALAKQSIDRSSPIQHALEGLLLQLN